MTSNIKTLELAKLYEQQGYYKDALDIYLYLDEQNTGTELQEGIKRLEAQMTESGDETSEKISGLCEEWVRLLIMRFRLDNCMAFN
jgi:hypothetical protein